jgi:hypothetical protein
MSAAAPDFGAEYYKAYEEHSKVLRTWLVAYGIGAPVLFLTADSEAIQALPLSQFRPIGKFFVSGVIAQVLLAAVNKTVMWACYYAERNEDWRERKRFKVAYWISEQFWIDFIVDLATLAFFGRATWQLFELLLAAAEK